MESSVLAMKIEIRKMVLVDDATASRTLNENWITKIFSLEAKDVEILGHPQRTIVDKGGRVFDVSTDGEAVGCVAMIPIEGRVYSRSSIARKPRKARTASSQSWHRSSRHF
jgi:putative acetyltransferase